ncbi:type II toxin-antitoxin system VapC family toxin [Aureimonas mangrovi]|uniref:type II toxin-antitoxin system VapC family toxin n=1 Tax=Aureimonas mangrovi TaxID=2758041 RepID=UPI00163DB88C|nr:type II toxin-antitoxin system VapC family toxin [Aureimonas mangrovi]
MIAIDTSALFAVLNAEPEAHRMSRSIIAADARVLSAPSLVELAALCSRRLPEGLERMNRLLRESEVSIAPFDRTMADLASLAYETYGKGSGSRAGLNLGDCFSYALAKSLDAPLLYKGDDFSHTDIRSAIAA